MSGLPLAQWDPSLFSQLKTLLALLVSQPAASTLRRFNTKLEEARPWVLALTALPPPNAEDSAYVASTPVSGPDGRAAKLTGQFLDDTSTISQTLNVSQLLAAKLVLWAISERSRYPERSVPEIAVYIFHTALRDLLDLVRELLRVTVGPEAHDGDGFAALSNLVQDILDEKSPQGYLADVVIDQLDALQTRLDTLVRTQASGTQFELLNFRVESLRAEQNRLATILDVIAASGLLKSSQVVKAVKWLKKCSKPDSVAAAVFAAFCAATHPIESLQDGDQRIDSISALMEHSKFVIVVSNIVYGETFTVPQIREAVRLQWSLFYQSALRNNATLLQSVQLDAEGAERHILESVAAGAFQFLTGLVNNLDSQAEDPTTALAARSDQDNNKFLYAQLEDLIYQLAAKRHFLRNLKNREEDAIVRRQSGPPAANFQAFLSLVAIVFQNLPPDSAESLWDESAFTSVALDIRSSWPPLSFWDMMTAISKGPTCASKCYEKLKDTRLSWVALFRFYHHYTEMMPHLFETMKTNRNVSMDPMAEEDLNGGLGWTRLLATVVNSSVVARSALLQAKPHPLHVLFEFVNLDVPTDLKAEVMNAITAFVKRRGDTADDDVVTRAVEYYERISFADPTLDVRQGTRVPSPIGWIQRMELTEQDAGEYPLTKATIGFLTALMPSDKSRVNNALRRGTQYIIDRVLLPQRRYKREAEQWEMLEAITLFLEKTLLSFDLTDLVTPARGAAAALADQPGFLVLLRILSEPMVFEPLAQIVDHAVAAGRARTAIVNKCYLHVLRIYYRILDIQLVFSDVLLLILSTSSGFKRPLSLQSLDQYLLNRIPNITGIALSVDDDDLEVTFVALKIIASLAGSPLFSNTDMFQGVYSKRTNRLAGILDVSDDSIRIAQGFCKRLDDNGDDISPEEIDEISRAVLAGESTDDSNLPIVIRSAILDLLVDGTADNSSPNVAHFLLGFDFRATNIGLQNPEDSTSRRSCLGVVLKQLNSALPLVSVHPVLAAKNAQLIYQLFANPITGPPTIAYAESYESFPAHQLRHLPRACPEITRDVQGMGIVATDNMQVLTSATYLVSYLDYSRYILSSVALQTFAHEGHGPLSDQVAEDLLMGDDEEDSIEPRRPLLYDMISVVNMTFTETASGDAAQDKVLEFYAGFPFDQYKSPGSDTHDLEYLGRALTAHRRQLVRQGAVIPGTSAVSMAVEADYILRRLAMQNRGILISIAKGSFLMSWNETLKVALQLLFHYVPEDRQIVFLFDLLDAVLNCLTVDLAPAVLETLCEAVLTILTTLVRSLSELAGANLPVERLQDTLLKIVEAAIRPGTTENSRGNLYASVSQYLQLIPEGSGNEHPLRLATVDALSARKDRYISILARDAMDMRDVWKTECYSLLASVASLGERSLVASLLQAGYLAQMVRSIKDREIALQECLSPDPENLHAYWVYEAKVGFLNAYASSPKGADDLVEAGLFQTFATCAFIAVQPFSDDVVDDVAACETVTRQHKTLICALQLLVRVLSSPTRSGIPNAISFLNAHRESLLVLLREDQAFVTILGINESRLIVALIAMVISKIRPEDFRSASGFGAFHHAILSLAAKFFDRAWGDIMREDASAAQPHVLELNQVLLAYFCAVTQGLKSGTGQPVFVTGTARSVGTQYIASAPSLPSAVDLVSDLAESAQDLSNSYDSVADKIAAGEDIDPRTYGFDADIATSDQLQAAFAARMAMTYNMIESLLLLLWRHLMYYANDAGASGSARAGEPIQPGTLSLSFSTVHANGNGLGATGAGAVSIKALERVAASLEGVLDRLDDVDASVSGTLEDGERGSKGREDAYHAMLIRRLRELCAGLTQ